MLPVMMALIELLLLLTDGYFMAVCIDAIVQLLHPELGAGCGDLEGGSRAATQLANGLFGPVVQQLAPVFLEFVKKEEAAAGGGAAAAEVVTIEHPAAYTRGYGLMMQHLLVSGEVGSQLRRFHGRHP